MQEAVEAAKEANLSLLRGQRAVAIYNTERDDRVTALPSFAGAADELGSDPQFVAAAGRESASRVVLQLTYDYLERLRTDDFDEAAFEATWTSFSEELAKPNWTYLSMANLDGFKSDSDVLELGDGISVEGRSFVRLREMGWSDFELEKLMEDWRGGGGQHVLIVREELSKEPDNLVLGNTSTGISKAYRMLLALRLAKEGDIHIGGGGVLTGRMLTTRTVGQGFTLLGGASMLGQTIRFSGLAYQLDESEISGVRAIYEQLIILEETTGRSPYNLGLALRSFSTSYDRLPTQADSRIVDLVTAVEALIGTEVEISFRLSHRAAGILAADDDARVTIYQDLRGFYDTRSRVVHGGTLNAKHQARLADYELLRRYVRQLLVAFLHLATTPGQNYGSDYFRQLLDIDLQHADRRSALRAAMAMA
jgi:hypothetical protein